MGLCRLESAGVGLYEPELADVGMREPELAGVGMREPEFVGAGLSAGWLLLHPIPVIVLSCIPQFSI